MNFRVQSRPRLVSSCSPPPSQATDIFERNDSSYSCVIILFIQCTHDDHHHCERRTADENRGRSHLFGWRVYTESCGGHYRGEKTIQKYSNELTSLWQVRQIVCAEAIQVVRRRIETRQGVFLVAQMRRMRVIRAQRAMAARFNIRRHVY